MVVAVNVWPRRLLLEDAHIPQMGDGSPCRRPELPNVVFLVCLSMMGVRLSSQNGVERESAVIANCVM